MKKGEYRRGFTLVEILLAVVIIGMLAAFLIPAFNYAVRSRGNAECARELRVAVEAFDLYASDTGSYPADRYPGQVPPEMQAYYFPYFKIDWWGETTPLGGHWDWDNGYHFKYSVSISSPTKSTKQLTEFDRLIDDGDLNTGNFRRVGRQYQYIIEE